MKLRARAPRPWPAEQLASLIAIALGALVFLPYLGAVGLWDPWETHYGEVAREMIERHDFIHPHYEKDWFFSKPPLTMWMQAAGMLLASKGPAVPLILGIILVVLGAAGIRRHESLPRFFGVISALTGAIALILGCWALAASPPYQFGNLVDDEGALPVLLEWGFRLPSTGFCIASLGVLAWALTRISNLRVALATTTVLSTMPLYFLISRQAVTDPPLISATIIGISCALVALFDPLTKRRPAWWYGAWFSFALATLAKGWLGFLVPGAVFGGYLIFFVTRLNDLKATGTWLKDHFAPVLGKGLVVGLVAGLAASRIAAVQGTVFISGAEIGAASSSLGTPANWLGLTGGLIAAWAATTFFARTFEPAPSLKLITLLTGMRLGRGVLLFLLVALPWYFEMFTFRGFDDEHKHFWVRFIVHDHLSRFFSGVFTTTPGGSFTYFVEQGGYAIFPWVLCVPGAIGVIARVRLREGATSRDALAVIALLWLIISWFAVGDSATKFHHYVFSMLPPLAILIGLFIDALWADGLDAHLIALLAGVPLFLLVGKDLWSNPKNFTDLFVFNYERPYPEFLVNRPLIGGLTFKQVLKIFFLSWFGLLTLSAMMNSKRALIGIGAAGALIFSLWFSWSHWVELSPQWTQRDQFWRYFSQRKKGEPIAGFMMNWRGETLYSRNKVEQLGSKPGSNPIPELQSFVARPGRKWVLTEHARLGTLLSAIGNRTVTQVNRDLNNKFVLLLID